MLITSDRRTVSYECAHVYAPARLIALEGSNTDGSLRWSTADRLAALSGVKAIEISIASRAGITTGDIRRLAFIDDVVARDEQHRSDDPARHQIFINACTESVVTGTQACAHFESSFVWRGRELQTMLKERANVLGIPIQDGRRLRLSTSLGEVEVRLAGFQGIDDPSYPSCAVLDLAWSEWRANHFSKTYTVLPNEFYGQQRQVAALSALMDLPKRGSITSLFVSEEGVVQRELDFGTLELISLRSKDG